jgi:hypothetical protein
MDRIFSAKSNVSFFSLFNDSYSTAKFYKAEIKMDVEAGDDNLLYRYSERQTRELSSTKQEPKAVPP